jgi:hypothetical protein
VPEICFVDPKKRSVRLLRAERDGYRDETITSGSFSFASIPGIELNVSWLFEEPRPDVLDLLNSLLAKPATE